MRCCRIPVTANRALSLVARKIRLMVGNQAGGMAAGRHAEPDDLGFSA
jgi:hypothetical protein